MTIVHDDVPRVRTPMLDSELRDTIINSLDAVNATASDNRIAMLFAALAFEHGAGADTRAPRNGRACWNCYDYDFGNRRGVEGDRGHFDMVAQEIIGGHAKDVGGIWPAFTSADQGMMSWIRLLMSRYAQAWEATNTGDVNLYAEHAKAEGYFTTDAARYAAGLATWMNIYHRTWPITSSFAP